MLYKKEGNSMLKISFALLIFIIISMQLYALLDKNNQNFKNEPLLLQGSNIYIPITQLSPGQIRFTQPNVDAKSIKLMKTKGHYDNGNSSISDKDAIPIVLGPDGLKIVIDNHHELLAAKKNGDITVPIEVKDDLSHLNRSDFFKEAQEKNYIYPVDLAGNIVFPPAFGWYTWEQMQDDPNRLFVAFTAWKCVDENTGSKDINALQDPEYPLWVKKLQEKVKLAFIEFKMATVLYKAGLTYEYAWGTNPNSENILAFTEKARAALKDALIKKQISPFDLIPEKTSRVLINKNNGGICTYTLVNLD